MQPLRERVKSTENLVKPIRRILVGLDGSASADDALHIAMQVAEKYSAEIDLIHVTAIDSSKNVAASNQRSSPSQGNEKEDRGLSDQVQSTDNAPNLDEERRILFERKRLVDSRGFKSETISVYSIAVDVGAEIVKRCNEGDYDLIVLGSRGLGRAKSFFLGSVSRQVVNEAKCSVLVSKTRIDSVKRVLLAYDGSDGSIKALVFASDLAKKLGAVINVVSAMSEPMMSAELDVYNAVDRLDREMEFYNTEAASWLNEMGMSSESARVVGGEKISIAIAKEAEKGNYDILALGTRGWGRAKSILLGSIASSVLDSSKANVLVVK